MVLSELPIVATVLEELAVSFRTRNVYTLKPSNFLSALPAPKKHIYAHREMIIPVSVIVKLKCPPVLESPNS